MVDRMGRMEGRILDLTACVEGEPFVMEDHLVEEPVEAPAKRRDNTSQTRSPLWVQFTEDWMCDAYARPCEFCRKPGAHYDHVNMFDKTDGIISMIRRGCPRAEVEAEIAKCQFLCRACHKKITRIEQKNGFMGQKRSLNRLIRENHDVSDLRAQLRQKYAAIMDPIYATMRGGGGGSQGK